MDDPQPCAAYSLHGLPALRLCGPADNECTLLLQGAQIWSCRIGGRERLFQSRASQWQAGKVPRGGIPLCWPWLGRNPSYPDAEMHGPLRLQSFAVEAQGSNERHAWLRLGCDLSTDLDGLLSPCRASYHISLSAHNLTITLAIHNLGDQIQPSAGALHTYLALPVEDSVIHGLEHCPWHGPDNSNETGTIELPISDAAGRTRTVHQQRANPIEVQVANQPVCRIQRLGSRSVVLWNPGANSGIGQLAADEWREFLCIETANSDHDRRLIAPGQKHCMATRYQFS